MRELLLFVLVLAVMVVTTALAAISGVSVSSSVSREPNDTDRASRPAAPEGQRGAAGDRLASGDERPAPRASDAQRGGDDAEGAALFGVRAGDRQATAVANALQRERLQAQLMPVQEMVNRISNAFQKLFVEDTPDIIPMDAERNLKKKRDLGMDAETDLFQIGVFDDRDVPLGNKDSLSFINALERFRRKPSIIEVPVYPPKLIYVRSNPYKQIDHRVNVNLDTSDDTNKEETYSSVSSNETEWVNDTSKDEDTNSALMDISKEGDTVPPEEYVNKSFVESLPQEIPDEDWETARQDLFKADSAPETPEVFSEGRGTPVPALMGEELSKEEGDPAVKAEAEGQVAFVGGGVLLRVASGEAAGSPVAGDAGAGGREGDGSAAGVTGKTQTAEVRAARSRLHVALGALGVVAVALLVAATPVVQRVVVTMWYPRPRDVDRFGEDGDGDDCGGDAGDAGDDEMLVPSGKTKGGWKRGGGGVWAKWRRASGVEAMAAAAGPHPRLTLSRLRAALLAAARGRLPRGARCHVVRMAACAPSLAPRAAAAPDPAPASLVIGGGVYV